MCNSIENGFANIIGQVILTMHPHIANGARVSNLVRTRAYDDVIVWIPEPNTFMGLLFMNMKGLDTVLRLNDSYTDNDVMVYGSGAFRYLPVMPNGKLFQAIETLKFHMGLLTPTIIKRQEELFRDVHPEQISTLVCTCLITMQLCTLPFLMWDAWKRQKQ